MTSNEWQEKVPLKNIYHPDIVDKGEHDPDYLVVQKLKEDTEEPKREKWGNVVEFFLSCIGYAVGLGDNIFQFQYSRVSFLTLTLSY